MKAEIIPMPAPSELAQAPFVSVANMMRLVHHLGLDAVIRSLAGHIEGQRRLAVCVLAKVPCLIRLRHQAASPC